MDREYLFRANPEEQLRRWARRLKYFRYFRAFGGHANDGDALHAALRYGGEEDLLGLAAQLGLEVRRPPEGEAGSAEAITDCPGIAEFDNQTIRGVEVFVSCEEGQMTISIQTRDGYTVSEEDAEAARSLEPLLEPLADRLIDPPTDTDHYLCPEFYPNFFTA